MPKKQKTASKSKDGGSHNPALDALADEAKLVDREVLEMQASDLTSLGFINDEPENELGKRLEYERRAKSLTQGELAALTKLADRSKKGLSRGVISLYELGTNRPGPKEIRLLCETLRITPSYLIYGDDHPFEDNMTELVRHGLLGRSSLKPEFYARMVYCFASLHPNQSLAMMDIMMDLLRGRIKGFDAKLAANATKEFLEAADKLRLKTESQ